MEDTFAGYSLSYIESLPLDLQRQLALDLSLDDLDNLCRTSRTLAKICNDETFWRLRLQQDFPNEFKILDKIRDVNNVTYKKIYEIYHYLLRNFNKLLDKFRDLDIPLTFSHVREENESSFPTETQ